MIPRPFGCDGNECDYEDGGVWVHVDCGLAPGRGASQMHLAYRRTRAHFEANPLPVQANRRSA